MNFRAYNINTKTLLPLVVPIEELYNNLWSFGTPSCDLVFMRGTGVLDEEMKEIFEGDYCKNELGEHGCITYSDGSFWLMFFDEPAKQHLSDFKKYDKDHADLKITGIRSFNNDIMLHNQKYPNNK